MFEHLHIDFAKKSWHTSNQCNEFPQMIHWLFRHKKISWFESHLSTKTPPNTEPAAGSIPRKSAISITKSPKST